MDFTLDKYIYLCRAILGLRCPVMTVEQYLARKEPSGLCIVLRHDVDRHGSRATRMAELESDLGVRATYYLRTTPKLLEPSIIKRIRDAGHEVGYHYETLATANGDYERAIALFERELARLREYVPVRTISMHGSPLSEWNNLNLWERYRFEDFDLAGDAVLSMEDRAPYYFTDTGRSWHVGAGNLRDKMNSLAALSGVRTTDDLVGFLENRPDCAVCINAHPNRWASNAVSWTVSLAEDWLVNCVKRAVRFARRERG